MSSFDPPLSRTTALMLVIGAVLVFAWVLVAAHLAPSAPTADTVTGKPR